MVGSYYYLTYKNGRLVKRRTYRRNLYHNYSNEEHRYFGKKRLVRPIYKRGLHRYSKPWKHYRQYSTTSGQFKPCLPCGYSSNQLWIGICRAWNAFTIWKQKNDREMMQYYGLIIHKLQKKLDLPLTKFEIYIGDESEEEVKIKVNLTHMKAVANMVMIMGMVKVVMRRDSMARPMMSLLGYRYLMKSCLR